MFNRKLPLKTAFGLFGMLVLLQFSCAELPSTRACDEAFYYNRKVVADDTKIPYMKTCGLTVNTAKFLSDVYSREISVSQDYADTIYDELEITDRIFTEHQIPYFIVSGTLLGAIRNGGLIPNDDDADIGVNEKYEPEIIALAGQFDQAGYELNTVKFSMGGIKIIKKGTKSNGLDIFPMKERIVNTETVIAFARDGAYNAWPKEVFEPRALDNLIRIKYGHLQLSSVSLEYAIKYLNSSYGVDWYLATYKIWNHVEGKPGKNVKEKLLSNEYYYLSHSKTR